MKTRDAVNWFIAAIQAHPDRAAAVILIVAAFFLGRCTA